MRMSRRHCLFTLISVVIVVISVCIGVTMNLTTIYDENFDQMGIKTFMMFTVNSNILCAISMALVFPYTIDGLRKHNYHLPRWVVNLVFAGVTSVTLTFLVSLFILSRVKGFVLIFTGSRFFLHGLCPVLAIIAFVFFISEQRLRVAETLYTLVFVFICAALYFIMVVLIGEHRGGWKDFYGFATRIPVLIPMITILPLTFGIGTILRILHNRSYDLRRQRMADFCREYFQTVGVKELVAAMARFQRIQKNGKDILIPGRVINIMVENSKGDCTWEECCEIYFREYLAGSDMKEVKKLWI